MTRKDYEALAGAMRRAREEVTGVLNDHQKPYGTFALNWAIVAIMDVLEEDNPRFDRGRFERACHEHETERASEAVRKGV